MKRSGQPGLQPAEIEAEWAHAPPGREAAFRNELMRALHQLLSEQYGRDRPPLVHRSRRPLPSASKRAKPVAREVARGRAAVRQAALLRAFYRCEVCSSREQLELHHVGNRHDRSLFNAKVLCSRCHLKEHKRRANRHFGQYRWRR